MSIRRHVWVLAALIGLALLLTFPLALHVATHVPGDGIDDPALAWNLWWVKFSLVDHQANPFDCTWLFYPVGINLAFYTLTVLNGLLSVPLQVAINVVAASNLLLLMSFVLGGYGAYLLTLDLLLRQRRAANAYPAAFLAGVIYAFASSKLFYAALGQFNIASSQWIPFCALYLMRIGRATSRRQAVRAGALAGLFLGLQLWAEMTFASFLVVLVALSAVWWLLRDAHRSSCSHRLQVGTWANGLVVMGCVTVLLAAPMLAAMLPDLRAEPDLLTSGGGFAAQFSADLAGYAQPTQLHPLFGRAAAALPFPHDKGQQLYIGYSVLLLALAGAWTGRRQGEVRFWAAAAGLFFWLTLGPTLRVAGHDTGVAGPFAILARLPFFEGNRYPSRYSVLLMLALALLAAQGTAALLDRRDRRAPRGVGWRSRVLVGVALCMVLFEHASFPLPLSDLSVPAPYERLAREPGDFAVLEIPPGWRNGARVLGKQDVLIMSEQWYQTVHQKRVLGGNTSRNSAFKFQYFSQAPVLSTLIALTNAADQPAHERLRRLFADPGAWQALQAHDRPLVRDLLTFLDVRYVVVHDTMVSPELQRYLDAVFPLVEVTRADGVRLLRVDAPAAAVPAQPATAGERDIDLTSATGTLLLGEGWSAWSRPPLLGEVWQAQVPDAAWAARTRARLMLPLDARRWRITLTAAAAGPGQTLRVRLNGWVSPPQALAADRHSVTIDVPAQVARPGLNDVWLEFVRLYPTSFVISGNCPLGQTGTNGPLPILVESAGEETGDYAHVWIDGRDVVTEPGEPGYHMVVVDPVTGHVEGVWRFNTLSDPGASATMAAAIAAVPAGHIVAVAAADEASLALQESAVRALSTIGAIGDLRGHFRWSHAILGVKGARPGQAAEALGALQPVAVTCGGPWREAVVAAAVASVAWSSPD